MAKKSDKSPASQAAALPDLSGPLYQASQNLGKEIDELKPKEAVFLHYCSLEAFYEIMDSARLRFTSARSTNDPSEFLFGMQQVRSALADPQFKLRPKELEWLDGARSLLESREFRAFVFCMSEASEDEAQVGELSQWRLYGSNGRGVALVFDVTDRTKRQHLERSTSIPRKVAYGTLDGQNVVRAEIRRFFETVRSIPSPDVQDYANAHTRAMVQYLLNVVFWMPSVIKHNAYRHEREVRLVRGDIGNHVGNPLVFFERNGIRRPAVEISLDPTDKGPHRSTPIRRVVIGPSGDQSAIADSIRYFLEARDWQLEVEKSDIPYRAIG